MSEVAKSESEEKINEVTVKETPPELRQIKFADRASAARSARKVMDQYQEVFRKLAE